VCGEEHPPKSSVLTLGADLQVLFHLYIYCSNLDSMEIDKIIKEAELAEQEVAELTSALVKFNTASS